MIIKKLKIKGCYEIKFNQIKDERGYFSRVYDQKIFKKIFNNHWVQHNESLNIHKHTFRGMHLQIKPFSETKLVRVIKGKIIDLILDLRKTSKTYKYLLQIKLSEGKNMILIPRGCAHGYLTLSKNTRLSYLHDNFYSKKHEINLSYNDQLIKKKIKFKIKRKYISQKDLSASKFENIKDKLIF